MKDILIVLSVTIAAIIIIYLGRMYSPFIDDVGLLVVFSLLIKYRHSISAKLSKIPIGENWIYILSSLPFIIFEENINCLSEVCKLFPITIPFLIIYLLVLLFIVKKFNINNFWLAVIIFSVVGVLWEISVGAASAEFRTLPLVWFILVFSWTWISYAFLAIIPLSIIINKK